MNCDLLKIISKYNELDGLSVSGEDVVADLRKEINNLELAYLKDIVLPKLAKNFGAMVKGLRCEIDGNLRFDKDQKIEYAFGTSINMVMLKGEIIGSECNDEINAPVVSKNKTNNQFVNVIPDLRIEDYSEKAIVVRGDTRQISDILTAQNGILNFRLNGGAGWIFPKSRQCEVEEFLKPYLPHSESAEESILTAQSSDGYQEKFYQELNSYREAVKKTGIKSIKSGEIFISKGTAAHMFADFVNAIGPNNVRCMYIPHLGGFLVDRIRNNKYAKACIQLNDGSWLNPHSNTEVKVKQIKKICEILHRDVEIKLWEEEEYSENEENGNGLKSSEPDLFSQAGVNIPLSDAQWVEKILNMRSMQYKGYHAPHKAIFILAIIEAINEGTIQANRIFPSNNLANHFDMLWKKYVPLNWPFLSNVYQPYIHLASEPFYTFVKQDGITNFDINQSWNRGSVSKYVEYTYFDDELFRLLHDKEFTEYISTLLIDKFITKQIQNHNGDVKMNHVRHISDKSSIITFKDYLSNSTSNSGKKYTGSSIRLYTNALKSKYILSKVIKFSNAKDLEGVVDLKIIDKILSEVKFDSKNGLTNRAFYAAIRLYRDFRYYKIKSPEDANCFPDKKRDNSLTANDSLSNEINNETINTPEGSNRIASIETEDIYIQGDTTNEVFVNFINTIGPDLVHEMKIDYMGDNLVTKKWNPYFTDSCLQLNDDYWLNISPHTQTVATQIKEICAFLSMEVSISIRKIESDTEYSTEKTPRAKFSLNGGKPMNKRRTVLEVLKLYMETNPTATFSQVESDFPKQLQGGYGVVASVSSINKRRREGQDVENRYYLDKDKIMHSYDDIEFAVSNQWGHQFRYFQEYVGKKFGWIIEEI